MCQPKPASQIKIILITCAQHICCTLRSVEKLQVKVLKRASGVVQDNQCLQRRVYCQRRAGFKCEGNEKLPGK